jgi:hypothetical protein
MHIQGGHPDQAVIGAGLLKLPISAPGLVREAYQTAGIEWRNRATS